MQTRLLALVLLLSAFPLGAGATIIDVSWTGTIYFAHTQALLAAFPLGTPASGSFQIDTAVVDDEPDPTLGTYNSSVSQMVFDFGGYKPASTGVGAVTIEDALTDDLQAFAPASGPDVANHVLVGITVSLADETASVFSQDVIPLNLDLADFTFGNAALILRQNNTFDNVTASISTLSYVAMVPEPGTGALLALGVAALAVRRRVRALSAR